jgi:alpha(1,3/1,4) fucosyltransferase
MDAFIPTKRPRESSVAICAVNVWPSFSLWDGLISYILEEAFGAFHRVAEERDADIVLTSVFPHNAPKHPEKSIAFIWENIRPNYEYYRFSISSDFDSYGGRNCRVPVWYGQINWSDRYKPTKSRTGNHNYEEPVDVDLLLQPREHIEPPRKKFCCFVSRYREAHRALAVGALSRIAPLDIFGAVSGKPLSRSKYEILPDYRFNLCFENSIFPGYYTEKILHAWAAGCIPLYWSDPWFVADFNPRSMINRIDFSSLEAFVDYVAAVDKSPERMATVLREPLLLTRPSLDEAIGFLRRALSAITNGVSGMSPAPEPRAAPLSLFTGTRESRLLASPLLSFMLGFRRRRWRR